MTAIDFSDADDHGRLAREPLNVEINALIERAATTDLPRGFLGASIVGHHCLRQIQFDWWCRPLLADRVRLIFDRGHFFEAEARRRLVAAGFMFAPPEALAFIALDGFLQGHADGDRHFRTGYAGRLSAASLRVGVQSLKRKKLSCGRARRTRKGLPPLHGPGPTLPAFPWRLESGAVHLRQRRQLRAPAFHAALRRGGDRLVDRTGHRGHRGDSEGRAASALHDQFRRLAVPHLRASGTMLEISP